jgi:hypothetical protein
MCNDYAREIEAGRVIRLMKEMENIPPFGWEAGRIPNDAGPTPHVKITEKGLIARLKGDHLIGSMTTWAWKTLCLREQRLQQDRTLPDTGHWLL